MLWPLVKHKKHYVQHDLILEVMQGSVRGVIVSAWLLYIKGAIHNIDELWLWHNMFNIILLRFNII